MSNAKVWLVTAWEEEYQLQNLFAKEEDAQACASRWRDDLLDLVEVKLIDLWEEDVIPF